MTTQDQIEAHLVAQPEPKRGDLRDLHRRILQIAPESKLWFLDGKDATGKMVTNPNIGYGSYTIAYKDGTTREFYRVGFSSNTGGISVYIMGLDDKTFLARTYGDRIGKASVTSYCIKFKTLNDIHLDVLETAVRDRLESKP